MPDSQRHTAESFVCNNKMKGYNYDFLKLIFFYFGFFRKVTCVFLLQKNIYRAENFRMVDIEINA